MGAYRGSGGCVCGAPRSNNHLPESKLFRVRVAKACLAKGPDKLRLRLKNCGEGPGPFENLGMEETLQSLES